MRDLSSYKQLGVPENASFEEIQEAKGRLLQEHSGDRQRQQEIETAYDAILMDRLRLRQEGKIKVPEGIRFAEERVPAPAQPAATPAKSAPAWLQGFADTPSRQDILLPAGVFSVLGLLSVSLPSLGLAVGTGASLYFLNRKEHRFGRSLLLAFGGLIAGLLLWGLADALLQLSLSNEMSNTVAAWIALFVLWSISSFLK